MRGDCIACDALLNLGLYVWKVYLNGYRGTPSGNMLIHLFFHAVLLLELLGVTPEKMYKRVLEK